MEFRSFITTIVSVMVAVIVVMAMAVPIISNMTTHEPEHIDNALYRAEKIDVSQGTYTFTIKMESLAGDYFDVYFNDQKLATYEKSNMHLFLLGYPTSLWVTGGSTLKIVSYDDSCGLISGIKSMTIKIVDGVWAEKTANFQWLIIPDDTGTLAAVDGQAEVTEGTCYWSGLGGDKSYSDDRYALAFGNPFGDTSGYCIESYHYNGVPTIDSISVSGSTIGAMTITPPDSFTKKTPYEIPLLFAPYEIKAEDKSTTDTLIDLIPLLMIVGLMVAVVAAYYGYSKEE